MNNSLSTYTLIFLLSIFINWPSHAQEVACIPDTSYQNLPIGAYPLPFNNGGGGLAEFPACINEPYELVFTIKLEEQITILSGTSLDLLDVRIETDDAIEGLPEGIDYFCNPPDCIFSTTELGCIVLKGTPTSNNEVKDYDLTITGLAKVSVLGEVGLTFPGILASGNYWLTLNPEEQCDNTMLTTVTDYLRQNISLSNSPNPVISTTSIEVTSLIVGDFQLTIHDMGGKIVYNEQTHLKVGFNTIPFDASNLTEGTYIYTIDNGTAMISELMLVQR